MRLLITGAAALAGLLLAAPLAVAQGAEQSPPPAPKPTLNLNLATLDQLETLPGVGRKTAERILEYRQKSGGFKKIEELMNVKGIGEKSFLRIKPYINAAPKPEKATGGV